MPGWLTNVLIPILFGAGCVALVLRFDEVFDFVREKLTTRKCARCEERKPLAVCEDYYGDIFCKPCLVKHKKEGREEEERRLLNLEVMAERRRVAARKYVQDEQDNTTYRE